MALVCCLRQSELFQAGGEVVAPQHPGGVYAICVDAVSDLHLPAAGGCRLTSVANSNMPEGTILGARFGSNSSSQQACLNLCLSTPRCQTAVYWTRAAGSKCFLYAASYTAKNTPSKSTSRKPSEVLYCAGGTRLTGAWLQGLHCTPDVRCRRAPRGGGHCHGGTGDQSATSYRPS